MQLPRGTFCGIRKKQITGDILMDLKQNRFTGTCSISCHDGICTLVFRTGTCILAEYKDARGDAALERLLLSVAGDVADASLSVLDETQIRLSLEFNTAERIVQVQPPHHRARPNSFPLPTHRDLSATVVPPPLPERKTVVQKEPLSLADEPDNTLFEDDLDTLDTLDLDTVRTKIRDECKSVVRHLGLEHLIDKN